MTKWTWDKPCAFVEEVKRSNLRTINPGKVERTGERFFRYTHDDLR